MNPDEIPLPIAIPLIVVLWTIWLAPYVRAAHRRTASHQKENHHV